MRNKTVLFLVFSVLISLFSLDASAQIYTDTLTFTQNPSDGQYFSVNGAADTFTADNSSLAIGSTLSQTLSLLVINSGFLPGDPFWITSTATTATFYFDDSQISDAPTFIFDPGTLVGASWSSSTPQPVVSSSLVVDYSIPAAQALEDLLAALAVGLAFFGLIKGGRAGLAFIGSLLRGR